MIYRLFETNTDELINLDYIKIPLCDMKEQQNNKRSMNRAVHVFDQITNTLVPYIVPLAL